MHSCINSTKKTRGIHVSTTRPFPPIALRISYTIISIPGHQVLYQLQYYGVIWTKNIVINSI